MSRFKAKSALPQGRVHYRRAVHFLSLAGLLLALIPAPAALAGGAVSPSLEPLPRLVNYPWMSLARWYEMHAEDVQQAAEGEAPLVFIGDSITEGWAAEGAAEWARYFGPRGAVNFGIGGDMTQNLIWRLHNGAAGQLDPSAVVLLIGVNNLSFSTDGPATIGAGVIAVVDALEDSFPKADILLLGVLPAGASAQDPLREKIRLINQLVANLDQREMVTFLDTGALFLEPDGSISSEIMPDYLHLSPEAYKRWAAAISPWVEQHLK